MQPTLQGIFQAHFERYASQRKLPLRALKAAQAILACRSPALGGHIQRCPEGHLMRVHYNACRHRSCTTCSALPRAHWAEREATRLLGCAHYHVVFTVPHELILLWQYNRHWFADTLFGCASQSIVQLCADARFLGATPGIVMALHTWGRTLNHHPHVHCLVSGGGLTESGEWKPVRNGYLLPVRVLKALYRGKMLAAVGDALKHGLLELPAHSTDEHWLRCVRALYKHNWNVHLAQRYEHGQGVLKYLARYVKGGPIHDRRVHRADAHHVDIGYTDHHDGKVKRLRLSTDEFISRILWHVPEPAQHTVRHYGLYANAAKARLDCARARLGQLPTQSPPATKWQDALEVMGLADKARCPRCRRRLVRGANVAAVRKQNSISNAVPSAFAQPGVEVETPNAASPDTTGPPGARRIIFLRAGVPLN